MINFMIQESNKPSNQGKICPDALEEIPTIYYGQDADIHGFTSNCWSTTLYTLGASDKIKFVNDEQMEEWLNSNTKRISHKSGDIEKQFGDVLVLENHYDGRIRVSHTAIYLGNDLYWHQKFYDGPWQILSLECILAYYKHKYYHVKPLPKDQWKTDFEFLHKSA